MIVLHIETSSNNHSNSVFISFERKDIKQNFNITFYYNRLSILTNDSLKATSRSRIQLLLEDITWSTRYNIPINGRYSNPSRDWTLVSFNFFVENYGFKLIHDEIDSAHADMCFSNITITHSVYYMEKVKYFKDLFESIPDYRIIVLLRFLIKNDAELLQECDYLRNDFNRLGSEFKIILTEQNENNLDCIKDQEESIFENFEQVNGSLFCYNA